MTSLETEKFTLGSESFPAQGMSPDELLTHEQRLLLLERRGVPLDAQERFERTIDRLGYEHARVLPNTYVYPTVDEWLARRAGPEVQGWTRNAHMMIRDKETGKIFFCKALVGKREPWGGLKREAEVLQSLPKHVIEKANIPRFVHYEPPSNDGVEVLVTEAAPPVTILCY